MKGKIFKKICLPILLFGSFILAGSIGLYCESLHNDLYVSTVAFLTSFGSMAGLVLHTYFSVA